MKLGRLSLVGIATRSIEESLERYRSLFGIGPNGPAVEVPEQGVRSCFIDLPNVQIELIEPLGDASPIARFLEKNPEGGQHHLCFEVDDIGGARDWCEREGARILGPTTIGAHGRPLFFLHPKSMGGVLTVIMEAPASAGDSERRDD